MWYLYACIQDGLFHVKEFALVDKGIDYDRLKQRMEIEEVCYSDEGAVYALLNEKPERKPTCSYKKLLRMIEK